MALVAHVIVVIAQRLEQQLVYIAFARQVQRTAHRETKARNNLINIAYATAMVVSKLTIAFIHAKFIIDIEESIFQFPMASVLSELGSDTKTVFTEFFKLSKDRAFFKEARPFQVGVEISCSQMDRSSERSHFVDVGRYAPHAVSDDVDYTDWGLFTITAHIDDTPLATFFRCRIVDNTHLELIVFMCNIDACRNLQFALLSRIDACRNLQIALLGHVDTCDYLTICRLGHVDTRSNLELCRLGIIDARRNLQTLKSIDRQIQNTDLCTRRFVSR